MSGSSSFVAVEDLDAAATLAAAEAGVPARRAAEVEELLLALHWADLHADDPRAGERDGRPLPPGAPRLVRVGGEGTPKVQDLALCELAIAREQHALTVRAVVADGLDLRHRLPSFYRALLEGRVDLWVARKVASMTRKLTPQAAAQVDRAATDAVDQGPGRVLAITEARVIEADEERARADREAARRQRYVAITPTDDHGLRTLIGAVEPADAVWLDATLEKVADALDQRRDLVPDLPTDVTRDELRSLALGWLAHPEDVAALLAGQAQPRGRSTTSHAAVHVHLHQAALEGTADGGAVARVEEIGPLLLEDLAGLLGHTRITLAPVIDLNQSVSVNGYEHPEAVKERTRLRTIGDVFPHAAPTSRHTDMDHPTPYDPTGPPGQTGDHNAAPLGRRHHRAKTHLRYRARQLNLGRYLWHTPHGLRRLVDATGTHQLDPAQALQLEHPGALDTALTRVEIDLSG